METAPDLRILIIDDNEICAKLLARKIRSIHYEEITIKIAIHNSPLKALDDLKNTHYGIIFTDIEMTPAISGVDIARFVRKDDDYIKNRDIPIYAVTCKADKEARILYKEAGITECFEKPVKHDSVRIIINTYIKKMTPM